MPYACGRIYHLLPTAMNVYVPIVLRYCQSWNTLIVTICSCTTLLFTTTPASATYIISPEIQSECAKLKDRVTNQPTSTEARFEYAVCLSWMGLVEESRLEFKAVKKLDTEFRHKALPVYLERYRQNPDDLRAAYRLAFVYYFNDKPEKALRYFSLVATHHPVSQINAWALGYMAVIKGEAKDWNEAERLAREALRLEPEAYGLHFALAVALKGEGRYIDALQAYFTARKYKDGPTQSATDPSTK